MGWGGREVEGLDLASGGEWRWVLLPNMGMGLVVECGGGIGVGAGADDVPAAAAAALAARLDTWLRE